MQILIIGGTRFMGPHVARQLAAAGHAVTLFHRHSGGGGIWPEGIVHRHGDRNDPDALRTTIAATAPEVIVDMIALTASEAAGLVTAARGHAGRLVVISSMDVYRTYARVLGSEPGPPDPPPTTEDSPLRERHYPYRRPEPRAADDPDAWMDDYDKILVEEAVRGVPDLPATVLRLPMVYGPHTARYWEYGHRILAGRPAILLDSGLAAWRTPRGYVENVAAAIVRAATRSQATGRVYNVADPYSYTEAEWVALLAGAAGWPGRVVVAPPAALAPTVDPAHAWIADTTRLETELGYTPPVDLPTALARTVAWWRSAPPALPPDPGRPLAEEDAILAAAAGS